MEDIIKQIEQLKETEARYKNIKERIEPIEINLRSTADTLRHLADKIDSLLDELNPVKKIRKSRENSLSSQIIEKVTAHLNAGNYLSLEEFTGMFPEEQENTLKPYYYTLLPKIPNIQKTRIDKRMKYFIEKPI